MTLNAFLLTLEVNGKMGVSKETEKIKKTK